MAFDVSAISGYVEENEFELIAKTIFSTDLANEMEVRVGLKGDTVAIPLLEGDFIIQNGALCGYDSQNTTTITEVDMIIANNKFNATYCPQVLRDTFLSKSLAAGAMGGGESLPFEALLADYYVQKLKEANEKYIIQGDATRDGLADLITEGTGAIPQGGTISAWDTTNAIAQAQALALAIPDAVADRDDLIMVVSPAAHRAYKLAVAQADLYHYGPDAAVYVIGTNVRLVAASGLSGDYADVKFAGPKSFLILGTDLTSDAEQFSLRYSNDNDELRAIMRWRIGVAVTQTNMFSTTVVNP